jgi:hypothetical protein
MARPPINLPWVAVESGGISGRRDYDMFLSAAARSAVASREEAADADLEEAEGCRVFDQNRPLLLVVCGDEPTLASVRRTLRAAGFLCTSGRSVEAALSLLTQVRVDGCVVVQPLDEADARRLTERLEQYDPDCIRVCAAGEQAPLGWRACDVDGLPAHLRELFG